MYTNHVPKIRQAFESDPKLYLVRVVDFVLATIQQRFHTVQSILDDWHDWEAELKEHVSERDLSPPGTLWGMKRDGFQYVRQEADRLAGLLTYALARNDAVDAIDTLLEVPGLGIAKSGFVAQLLGLPVGCLDTHNLRIYDIAPEAFSYVPKRAKDRLALIESYVNLCASLGGSEALWDRWCHFIAVEQSEHFYRAEDVSDEHVVCILY